MQLHQILAWHILLAGYENISAFFKIKHLKHEDAKSMKNMTVR